MFVRRLIDEAIASADLSDRFATPAAEPDPLQDLGPLEDEPAPGPRATKALAANTPGLVANTPGLVAARNLVEALVEALGGNSKERRRELLSDLAMALAERES